MRLSKLEEGIINSKLAIPLKTKDGRKLVNEGTIVSKRLLDILINSGFQAIYIEDENYDVELQESVDTDSRTAIYTKLEAVFAGIEKGEFNSIELLRFIRLELLANIKNEPVSIPADRARDKDDRIEHSFNVAILAVRTATALGFNMEKLELMAFIALLHDIGKIIQKKDKKLMDIPHNEIAYEFLKDKNCSVLSYMSIRFQNETYDEKGPNKITREKQIIFSKVLSICDYYETLLRATNDMPYECFEKTQAFVNTRFDPEVFKAFRESLYIYPLGLPVQLNNKEEGIVVRQNKSFPLRPVVKSKDKLINLMENLSLFIEKVAI